MAKILKWGIIGTGAIARTFAKSLAVSKTGKLVAVASRSQETADKFSGEFKLGKSFGKYQELLDDAEVEAVYISTPHPFHAEWAIKAADAGKHILCEKPIGLNYPEAMAIIDSARRNDVFLMEAFMYRCHPQTHKLIELLQKKVIGDVRVIHAVFSFNAGYNLEGRLLNPILGGGGILDVGGYCASMARLIAAVANGRKIAEPIEVKATGHVGEKSRVDEYTIASLKFPGNILAEISAGVCVNQDSVVRIFGSKGSITVYSPWVPAIWGGTTKMTLSTEKGTEEIEIKTDKGLYTMEADTMAESIAAGQKQADWPAMTWDDTLGNMRTLDLWRHGIGMSYDSEKPGNETPVVDRRPLVKRDHTKMRYATIPGIDKPSSVLVIGSIFEGSIFSKPHFFVMFDEFFARGGNCIDTALIYGSGTSEKILGEWVNSRGIRKQVILGSKGAHTPWCTPDFLSKHVQQSLENLKTDYLDIYMLHRDNPDIPAGEFIDVLNRHKKAGHINLLGASNWTIGRIEKANEYAKSKGLAGFTVLSNNFSLARMVKPVWGGCISSSDKSSIEWFKKTGMVLLAWSSQARGFFAAGAPDNLSDKSLADCWYSEDNFKRLERTKKLAKKYKCQPTTIALAYVLYQPFRVFPIIGPRTLSELHSSFEALDINLTPEEVKYLNLED